jgi:hypothetical protein
VIKITQIVISTTLFYALIGVAAFAIVALVVGAVAIKTKIPDLSVLLKASVFGRPLVNVHTNLMESRLYAPKREGKKNDGNMYDVEGTGVKIIPAPNMIEHNRSHRIIQYYSKAGTAVSAKIAAACRDIGWVLNAHGIDPDEMFIDSLLVASDEELLERYPPIEVDPNAKISEDRKFEVEIDGVIKTMVMTNRYHQIYELRAELREMVIRDGQFVYQTVQDFIFAAQSETARAMDEYKGIANERAAEAAKLGVVKDNIMYVFYFVVLMMGFAIAYKILTQ